MNRDAMDRITDFAIGSNIENHRRSLQLRRKKSITKNKESGVLMFHLYERNKDYGETPQSFFHDELEYEPRGRSAKMQSLLRAAGKGK